jgi:polyhydroxyalkanoate synthesis regulator phasin
MKNPEEKKAELGIVEKIRKFFNLDDFGKATKAFKAQLKKLKKAIENIEYNKKTEKHRHDNKLEILEENKEIAVEALNEFTESIEVSNFATIEQSNVYFDEVFYPTIDAKQAKIQECEDAIEKEKTTHKEKIDEFDREIAKLRNYIIIIEA